MCARERKREREISRETREECRSGIHSVKCCPAAHDVIFLHEKIFYDAKITLASDISSTSVKSCEREQRQPRSAIKISTTSCKWSSGAFNRGARAVSREKGREGVNWGVMSACE